MNTTAAALLVLGLAVTGLPIAATLLVTIASKCEDSQWTLPGPPPGPIQAAARRLLAFASESGWSHSRRRPAPPPPAVTASPANRLCWPNPVAGPCAPADRAAVRNIPGQQHPANDLAR